VQLHSWGKDLSEAFEQNGMAMFGYMTELDKVEILEKHEIEAQADDLDGLLYHFLDELLFLFSAEPFLICKKLKITEFNLETFTIKCSCFGEPFDLSKHPQGTEVKAITYSAMQIIQNDEQKKVDVFVIIDI
jgi:SHS2 domain-containing protein